MRRSSPNQRKQRLRRPVTQLLIGPLLAECEGNKKVEPFPNTPSICCCVVPQIDVYILTEPREQHQTVKVPNAVAPSLCSSKFQRLATVRFNLYSYPLRTSGL